MSATQVIVGTLIYVVAVAAMLLVNKRHWDRERGGSE